jgi:hypothetical protein
MEPVLYKLAQAYTPPPRFTKLQTVTKPVTGGYFSLQEEAIRLLSMFALPTA